jgi:hypothetical protein
MIGAAERVDVDFMTRGQPADDFKNGPFGAARG